MELENFLNSKVKQYNNKNFIESDPISIPHLFTKKEDIEIIAFLVSSIAWGQRITIIKNGHKLVKLFENQPHNFILNHSESDLGIFNNFVHRTFNYQDLQYFVKSLQNIYNNYGGLETIFTKGFEFGNAFDAIIYFRKIFFELEHLQRTERHISNPEKNSAAKRLNMFLRWMVRNDKNGVDFGLWTKIQTEKLIIPLDVHSARIGRKLNLIDRKQNDRQTAELLTQKLQQYCRKDPTKYDFALFGIGVNDKKSNS